MSWVRKELKKRAAIKAREADGSSNKQSDAESTKLSVLWDRIVDANNALPAELKLRHVVDKTANAVPGVPPFRSWLMAQNGAGLGFNGEGIRYIWPKPNLRRSNNLWIRWKADKGYYLSRTVRPLPSSAYVEERRFNESRVDHMLRCLVTGARVTIRSISTRRLWLF
jgi:hypothetical protein